MKKRAILVVIFTASLFYIYYQIFSFSSHRTVQIDRSFDPALAITKTRIILIPISDQDTLNNEPEMEAPKYLLKEQDDVYLELNTKYFAFVLKW